MATKLNTEFNYRTQVIGETPWEKIKTLHGFLVGRKRAAVLEEVSRLKHQAKVEKLRFLKAEGNGPLHIQLELEAEIMEADSHLEDAYNCYRLNEQEIAILEKLLKELYEIVEPTRKSHPDGAPYTDEEMFEVNAEKEFAVWVCKEMHAEIMVMGHPSPAKLRNAMSCPAAWEMGKALGLIPKESQIMLCDANPLNLEMTSPLLITKGVDQ